MLHFLYILIAMQLHTDFIKSIERMMTIVIMMQNALTSRTHRKRKRQTVDYCRVQHCSLFHPIKASFHFSFWFWLELILRELVSMCLESNLLNWFQSTGSKSMNTPSMGCRTLNLTNNE